MISMHACVINNLMLPIHEYQTQKYVHYFVQGNWVTKQRQRKANLSEEQVGLLDYIGYEWEPLRGRRKGTDNKEELPPPGPLEGYL